MFNIFTLSVAVPFKYNDIVYFFEISYEEIIRGSTEIGDLDGIMKVIEELQKDKTIDEIKEIAKKVVNIKEIWINQKSDGDYVKYDYNDDGEYETWIILSHDGKIQLIADDVIGEIFGDEFNNLVNNRLKEDSTISLEEYFNLGWVDENNILTTEGMIIYFHNNQTEIIQEYCETLIEEAEYKFSVKNLIQPASKKRFIKKEDFSDLGYKYKDTGKNTYSFINPEDEGWDDEIEGTRYYWFTDYFDKIKFDLQGGIVIGTAINIMSSLANEHVYRLNNLNEMKTEKEQILSCSNLITGGLVMKKIAENVYETPETDILQIYLITMKDYMLNSNNENEEEQTKLYDLLEYGNEEKVPGNKEVIEELPHNIGVRPIVTLKDNVELDISVGDGTKENPYGLKFKY